MLPPDARRTTSVPDNPVSGWNEARDRFAAGSVGRRAEVDAKRQHTVDQVDLGITDDREVHEVVLLLLHEGFAAFALYGREWSLLDRSGAVTEALEHCVDVEFGHESDRSEPRRAVR